MFQIDARLIGLEREIGWRLPIVGEKTLLLFQLLQQRMTERSGGEVADNVQLRFAEGAFVGVQPPIVEVNVFIGAIDDDLVLFAEVDEAAIIMENGVFVRLILLDIDIHVIGVDRKSVV